MLPEVSFVHAFVRQNFVADFTFDPPRRRQRRFLNGHPLHFYPLGNWSGEGLFLFNERYSVNFITAYSLVPKESNVTLVPHITLIRPNTLTKYSPITLIRIKLLFRRENR